MNIFFTYVIGPWLFAPVRKNFGTHLHRQPLLRLHKKLTLVLKGSESFETLGEEETEYVLKNMDMTREDLGETIMLLLRIFMALIP